MQASRYGAPHSDLPEIVPESDLETYKYSVPDRTPPLSTVRAVPPYILPNESTQSASGQRTLIRWPLLILYGLVLALIAGVAGGFIGRSIERNSQEGSIAPVTGSCASQTRLSPTTSSIAPSPTSLTASTSSSTPTILSTTFVRTLAQPTTGCVSSTSYESFKARTKFLEWQYTTICGNGWLNDELIALSAATSSDCVEACVMYNAHKSSTDRSCVGGGFIPEWWNQTRAMAESGAMPYNCFLKSNASGIARNDKVYEVVALCVDGACDDMLG